VPQVVETKAGKAGAFCELGVDPPTLPRRKLASPLVREDESAILVVGSVSQLLPSLALAVLPKNTRYPRTEASSEMTESFKNLRGDSFFSTTR
jgi:hypothetical protein